MYKAPAYSFNENQAREAYKAWGCNCGPAALATILGMSLDQIRPVMKRVGFLEKGYTSPTMMEQAISVAGGRIVHCNKEHRRSNLPEAFPKCGLARIQWTGPWTAAGANAKWAYRQTHWVASWRDHVAHSIFDINSGIGNFKWWSDCTVPMIVDFIPRADGGWFVTHSWEVARG